MSFTARLLTVSLVAVALPACGHGGRTGNLIVNPGADLGAASATGTTIDVPGWSTTTGATVAPYGTGAFPTLDDPGPPTRGPNFFFGGHQASASLTQSIDAAPYASAIDGGGVTFDLEAWLGGYLTQTDAATVTLHFVSSTGADLGGSASLAPVTHDDRHDATAFIRRTTSGSVPASTRTIVVAIESTRLLGGDNDGYADSLSLELSGI